MWLSGGSRGVVAMSLRRFPGPLAGCVHRTALLVSPLLTAVQARSRGFDSRIHLCTTAKITFGVADDHASRMAASCRHVMGRRASPRPSSYVL